MLCFFPSVPDTRSMAYTVGLQNGVDRSYLQPILLAKMRWLAAVDVRIKSVAPLLLPSVPAHGSQAELVSEGGPSQRNMRTSHHLRF
jgi:hypothetical protein